MTDFYSLTDKDILLKWDIKSSKVFILDNKNKEKKSLDLAVSWIWSSGFISNRNEIIKRRGLEENTLDDELFYSLYQEIGQDALKYIFGSYSFVLWDSSNQQLVVARDRSGYQGIYFAEEEKFIIISSQIRSIVNQFPQFKRINILSLVAHINNTPPPLDETFFKDIRCLEPATLLVRTDKNKKIKKYWQIDPYKELKLASELDYSESYRQLLFDVIEEYSPDIQVGVPLSGGLDSTTIAASLKYLFPKLKITAISWITPEIPESDEQNLSRLAATYLDLSYITIRADFHWPLSASEGIKTDLETPLYLFFTEAWEATLKEASKRKISILFSGASGDHLFGGSVYPYADNFLLGNWMRLFDQMKDYKKFSSPRQSMLKIFRRLVLKPILQTYLFPLTDHRKPPVVWLQKHYFDACQMIYKQSINKDFLLPGRKQRLIHLSDRLLPASNLLHNSIARKHNIEYRYPLLDHRLIEFAASLPSAETFGKGFNKLIMRNAMKDFLPNDIINKRTKTYPTAIAHRGLREREQAKVKNLLTGMRLSDLGLVDEERLRFHYQEYCNGKHNSLSFWNTITLEDWLRRHF